MSTLNLQEIIAALDARLTTEFSLHTWHHFRFTAGIDRDHSAQKCREIEDFIQREITFMYSQLEGDQNYGPKKVGEIRERHRTLISRIFANNTFTREEEIKILEFWARQRVYPDEKSFVKKLSEQPQFKFGLFFVVFGVIEGKEIEALVALHRHLLDSEQI